MKGELARILNMCHNTPEQTAAFEAAQKARDDRDAESERIRKEYAGLTFQERCKKMREEDKRP